MAKRRNQPQTKRTVRAAAPAVAPAAEARPRRPDARSQGAAAPDTRFATPADARAARKEAREAAIRRDRLRYRLRNALIGVGAVAAIVVILFVSGAFEPDIGISQPNEGGVGVHLPDGSTLSQKNKPPSSGPHYAARAIYGLATTPVAVGNWLHALEHGGVVVLYKCGDEADCSAKGIELRAALWDRLKVGRFNERKMVITPYQDMDKPITAVAWGRILPQDTLDADAIVKFYERYLDKGPENAA